MLLYSNLSLVPFSLSVQMDKSVFLGDQTLNNNKHRRKRTFSLSRNYSKAIEVPFGSTVCVEATWLNSSPLYLPQMNLNLSTTQQSQLLNCTLMLYFLQSLQLQWRIVWKTGLRYKEKNVFNWVSEFKIPTLVS